MNSIRHIGTAGWSMPAKSGTRAHDTGTHLERYSRKFNCVEINSTFHREHQQKTFVKWRDSTPHGFRFSVKLSKTFTHEARLTEVGRPLEESISRLQGLDEKFGVLVVQTPKSLNFETKVVAKFLKRLRALHSGRLAWEPRHLSWTSEPAMALFDRYVVCKVQADPEPCPIIPEMIQGFQYLRLHGSPKMYRSTYSNEDLLAIAGKLSDRNIESWCIFDNTASGFALPNAANFAAMLAD